MTQSFTCYSVYLFIIWFQNLMRSMHVYLTSFEQSSKFHAAPGISKCRAHASLPFGRTYVHNFLYVLYLHWSPNPKCCLVPVKPSGPHIFKASTRTQSLSRLLRRGPARPSSTPTNPTAARIIGFLQEDEGEADLQWRRFQKKDLQWRPLPQVPQVAAARIIVFSFLYALAPQSEMMVASSVQLNAGKVGLCDLTPHRSFSTTAALRPGCLQFQPLLRTVIWCIARGTRRWMSHMSAKGVLLSVSPFRVRTDPA